MRSRQSTRYFSKKISVARVTNRITTRKSRQQWKRVGCLDEIEQIPAESAEQHDGNRIGERHRGNSRGQGVDPLQNGSWNSAHDHRCHLSFSYQRRSRGRTHSETIVSRSDLSNLSFRMYKFTLLIFSIFYFLSSFFFLFHAERLARLRFTSVGFGTTFKNRLTCICVVAVCCYCRLHESKFNENNQRRAI